MKIISDLPGGDQMNGILSMFYFSWLMNYKTGLFPLTICKYLPLNSARIKNDISNHMLSCPLATVWHPLKLFASVCCDNFQERFYSVSICRSYLIRLNIFGNSRERQQVDSSDQRQRKWSMNFTNSGEWHTHALSKLFSNDFPEKWFVFECIERTVTK